MMKRVLVSILLLAIVLVVALVLRVRQQHAEGKGSAGGSGVIEGVDVDVTSRIASRIAKINVREGDMVKQGDVIVELDCVDTEAALQEAIARLRGAEANFEASISNARSAGQSAVAAHDNVQAAGSQLAVVEAQESFARVELDRTAGLFKQGAATASAVDDIRSRYEAFVNQVAGQRAGVHAARDQADAIVSAGNAAKAQTIVARKNIDTMRAGVARAEVTSRECRLLAPRGGMIESRNYEPGESVQPGSVILTITDILEARTRFYLPNAELSFAAPGRKVRVSADAYPGQAFAGTIIYVSPRAEFTPRNVQTRQDRDRLVYAVEVRIPNQDMRLRSGMPVEVVIEETKR